MSSRSTLLYDHKQRMEKYLAGHDQWRPDAVTWYATSPSQEAGADVVALYTERDDDRFDTAVVGGAAAFGFGLGLERP